MVAVLAAAAVGLSGVALLESRKAGAATATPGPVPTFGWSGLEPGSGTPTPSRKPTPTETPTPTLTPTATPTSASPAPDPATGMDAVRELFDRKKTVSVLVLGDGSGDENDEWVAVWASTYLAKSGAVRYLVWDRATGAYGNDVTYGSGKPTVTVWNASRAAVDLSAEPARVATVWHKADLVIYSYGHRKTANDLSAALPKIYAAVQKKDSHTAALVMIQNPDPQTTEAKQRAATQAVQTWADENDLPTLDIYDAFIDDPHSRAQLVESDGSPTPVGSKLWAQTLNDALGN